MSNENKGSALEVAVSFLIGAAAGFVLGIVFAPASGKETRKKIQDEVGKQSEKAKEGFEKIAKEAEKGIKVVREKTQRRSNTLLVRDITMSLVGTSTMPLIV
jgi:gas vesicle protein